MKKKIKYTISAILITVLGIAVIMISSVFNQIRTATGESFERIYVYDVLSSIGVIIIAVGVVLFFKNVKP